jgi:choline monooxygenase
MAGRTPRFDARELHVDADVARAESLPAWTFTSPEFAEHELATVFARSWQLVPERASAGDDARPLSEVLAVRGARAPVSICGRPMFLQRGWEDGELRLFPNACTHAWHPLVLGPSRGNTLVCPQHGRKFDCAGRFVAQAGFQDLPGFPRECDHLRAMPASEWRGRILGCLGEPHAPLAGVLAPLEESIARLGLDRAVRRQLPQERREVEGNWKQHAWNYMDRFHITFVHRAPGGLADAIDLASYRTEFYGASSLQWAFARDPAHGFEPSQLPPRFADASRRVFALWWFVFPNLALSFYPWGLSINVYEPLPERPERTSFLWYHLVLDEARYEERERIWMCDTVDREDVDALAQVRRGIRSGFAPRGRFAPREETGPHWFHRRVSELVTAVSKS